MLLNLWQMSGLLKTRELNLESIGEEKLMIRYCLDLIGRNSIDAAKFDKLKFRLFFQMDDYIKNK